MEAPSLNDLLRKVLEREGAGVAPPGWYTSAELSKKWGLNRRPTHKLIEKAMRLGLMERKKFNAIVNSKTSYPLYHYAETNI